jgi:hypothetical protein
MIERHNYVIERHELGPPLISMYVAECIVALHRHRHTNMLWCMKVCPDEASGYSISNDQSIEWIQIGTQRVIHGMLLPGTSTIVVRPQDTRENITQIENGFFLSVAPLAQDVTVTLLDVAQNVIQTHVISAWNVPKRSLPARFRRWWKWNITPFLSRRSQPTVTYGRKNDHMK